MPPTSERQLLIMMLGTLGAGKSRFARELAKRDDTKRVNVDALRRLLFRNVEDWFHPGHNERVYDLLDRHTAKALADGYHVIRDSRHDSKDKRAQARNLAAETGALAVAVWIKTPVDLAIARGLSRPEAPDTVKLSEEFIRSRSKRHAETVEPPGKGELAIEIDGRAGPAEQMAAFESGLTKILAAGERTRS